MEVAETFAKLSYAKRLQVGSIIVKDDRIVSIGYNGTPSGWDNACEDSENKTKTEVIHAEANAISKLARSNESGLAADMFITHVPCMECSKLIYATGIRSVYYRNQYRTSDGLQFLKKCGVRVEEI
ncbi:CMP deaminase [bacterium]|nr:CMP deaminase [bacterium]